MPLVRLPEAWDGLRVAQLSDFHQHFSLTPLRKAIDIVNHLHPDLVVLTGDSVTVPLLSHYLQNEKRAADAAEPCARLLSRIYARFGMLAILGNHDAGSDPNRIIDILHAQDILVLRSRSISLEQGGKRLWLVGVDDALMGRLYLNLALRALYLPPLGRKYPWGLRRISPLTLHTNAGIGTIRVPLRFNCAPEITLITLRAAAVRGTKPALLD